MTTILKTAFSAALGSEVTLVHNEGKGYAVLWTGSKGERKGTPYNYSNFGYSRTAYFDAKDHFTNATKETA